MRARGSALHWLRRLTRNLLRGSRADADLRADVASYIDLLTDEKIAAGLSPDAARRAARLEFGTVDAVTDDTRSVRAGALVGQLSQDLRYALRMLRRDRGFSAVAVLTLALGIGANTAIFSVVNAVLLTPLAYADPGRLAVLWEKNSAIGKDRDPVAPLNFTDWQQHNTTFENLGAFRFDGFVLTSAAEAEQVTTLEMTSSVFRILQVEALRGRIFTDAEERRRDKVVVLTHQLWQRRFGGDAAVVGRSIALDGAAFTVIGVMPAGFRFPDGDPVDLYSPIVFTEDELKGRRSHSLSVIGRLKDGVTLDTATRDISTIARRIAAGDNTSNPDVTVAAAHDVIVEDVRRGLIVLFAAVGFVLLIACANVASLLLVRATTRQREMAMRAALGAGSRRLLRQLLTESVMLAAIGGAAGTAVAWWLLRLLARFHPPDLPRVDHVAIDLPVLLFVTMAAVLTGMLFGIVPALHAATPRLADAARVNSPTTTASARHRHTRSALLVAEIALSLMLLIAAGLMLRSFVNLQNVDLGFQPDHVVTGQVALAYSRYPVDPAQFRAVRLDAAPVADSKLSRFFTRLEEELRSVPGVESVAAVSALPLNPVGTDYDLPVVIAGRPRARAGEEPQADFRLATTGYFRTLRIPLLRGREFTEFDGPNSTPVAIINDTLARQMFAGEDPLGQRLLLYGRPREIVGVVGAVRHHGFSRDARAEMILPHRQFQVGFMTIVVRTSLESSVASGAVANAVHAIDAAQPVYRLRTMSDFLSDSVAQPRFTTLLLGGFAALALVLALVGVYGVMSYTVSQRAREIGVRLALGARRIEVVRMIVRQSLAHALVGVMLGLAGAAAATRLLAGLLFGVSATDPAAFAAAAAALVLASLAATYVPAFRASRVSPVSVLRAE